MTLDFRKAVNYTNLSIYYLENWTERNLSKCFVSLLFDGGFASNALLISPTNKSWNATFNSLWTVYEHYIHLLNPYLSFPWKYLKSYDEILIGQVFMNLQLIVRISMNNLKSSKFLLNYFCHNFKSRSYFLKYRCLTNFV